LDKDKHPWVRFGAVRSLVEMAALATSSLRRKIFSSVRKKLPVIAADQRSKKELESVLLISKVKRRTEWIENVSLIFRELYDRDVAPEAREHFERIIRKFNEVYA